MPIRLGLKILKMPGENNKDFSLKIAKNQSFYM